MTTTTDPDGRYSFTNLLPGTYTIVEIQPTNYLDGKETVGSLSGLVLNDQFSNIGLLPGGVGTNYNFGELLPASLSGFVYGDISLNGFNNGAKQASEQGISGTLSPLTVSMTWEPFIW